MKKKGQSAMDVREEFEVEDREKHLVEVVSGD